MIAFLLAISAALGQNCAHVGAATRVYGQLGSFSSDTQNNGGITASSLATPFGAAFDSANNVFIVDASNNRVLVYAPGSTTAFRVYGQQGSFTANATNNGGISASSLASPFGVAVDSANNVFIVDASNSRVLVYAPGSTTAFRVYGQQGNFTTKNANFGVVSASSLAGPFGVAVDSANNVYIADLFNMRVLVYALGSTTAFRVYGQQGSFASNSANNGGILARSLNFPIAVAVDSANNVYIADSGNNRVLVYALGSTTAFRVYGQSGSFASNFANNGGVSANSLSQPDGVTVDSANNVYVADSANNRVLVYSSGATSAFRVFGQSGSFLSNIAHNGGISASSFSGSGVAVDNGDNVYIPDLGRVLEVQCNCLANFISPTGIGPCSPCPAGTDASSGSVNCSPCSAGFFSPNSGQACQSCGAGFFSNSEVGSTACTICPAGSYSPFPGGLLSSCTLCHVGTASSAVGANASSTCQDCGAGSFSDVEGLSACKVCPSGTITVNLGSIACVGSGNSTAGGLPLGAIIGISIGTVAVGVVAAVIGGMFLYKRFTGRHDDYTEMMADEKGDGVFYKM
jgi:uncharacterized protein YjiK